MPALTLTDGFTQIAVFVALLLLIAVATWWKLKQSKAGHDGSRKDVYLAGGGLSWMFVAGSITLTNLSTDQLVGMNGNQMLLLAWWEIAGFFGLLILAFVFVPLYYRYRCTTVTELLERRYGGTSIRTLIAGLFLFGNIVIYLPASIYSGGLFMQSMFGGDYPPHHLLDIFSRHQHGLYDARRATSSRNHGHIFGGRCPRHRHAHRRTRSRCSRLRHHHRRSRRALDDDR